jgi:hypothetical protein
MNDDYTGVVLLTLICSFFFIGVGSLILDCFTKKQKIIIKKKPSPKPANTEYFSDDLIINDDLFN